MCLGLGISLLFSPEGFQDVGTKISHGILLNFRGWGFGTRGGLQRPPSRGDPSGKTP